MGVVIKYSVDFADAGFAVSNAPLSGLSGLLRDATITCTMTRGTANSGSTFEIRILNLPKDKGTKLKQRIAAKTPTEVTIKMGYADGPFETVMVGLVDKVRAIVETDDLTTIITGKESATHALQRAKFGATFEKGATLSDSIRKVVKEMDLEPGESRPTVLVDDGTGTDTMGSHSIRGANVMAALQKLVDLAHAELLVCDGKVLVGTPVKVLYRQKADAVSFDSSVNLGALEAFQATIPGDNDHDLLTPLPSSDAQGFTFQVTGDPNLRPGQRVSASIDGFDSASDSYRIVDLVHKFGPKDGYVCQGDVLKVNDNDPVQQRRLRASKRPTAQSLIDGLSQAAKAAAAGQSAVVEVGKVKEYAAPADGADKHLATLYYGQTFEPTETQPSIHVGIETGEVQVYEKKPIVSPFAWHKCGLVVPVYKDMKAVIAHNRGLGDDGMVTGFIWSDKSAADPPAKAGDKSARKGPVTPETAAIEPPASKVGDWWLCLPVDYNGDAPPSDTTKAANDITANNGKRVIEVKGLKITVGADKLGNVGVRPTEGEDNVFLIEHKSGTSFLIADDGTLTITASKVSIKGDLTIDGNVEIK